jgi:hypothetical protein
MRRRKELIKKNILKRVVTIQMIRNGQKKLDVDNNLTNSFHKNNNLCPFETPEYVDQLVRVARGPVLIDLEKIMILQSALKCVDGRRRNHKSASGWTEIWEGRVLCELERLVRKRQFPQWAAENLPFISAKGRLSRMKLAKRG